MMKNEKKPYVFPEEMPARERKIDNGVITDVVESETYPKKAENPANPDYSMWQYKGKGIQ